MFLTQIPISKPFAVFAAKQLANVDYGIATRVSEKASEIVHWSYVHDQWWLAEFAMHTLQTLDDFGSQLIGLVIWIVLHAN